jgi:hypothetical protein
VQNGRLCTVHGSFYPATGCEKVKVSLYTSSTSSLCCMATLHMLDYIESACLSSQCHVVDRGHKHTNGVCESCFYLRRPPPCNDVIQDVGNYDEEDTFISSQHADVQLPTGVSTDILKVAMDEYAPADASNVAAMASGAIGSPAEGFHPDIATVATPEAVVDGNPMDSEPGVRDVLVVQRELQQLTLSIGHVCDIADRYRVGDHPGTPCFLLLRYLDVKQDELVAEYRRYLNPSMTT